MSTETIRGGASGGSRIGTGGGVEGAGVSGEADGCGADVGAAVGLAGALVGPGDAVRGAAVAADAVGAGAGRARAAGVRGAAETGTEAGGDEVEDDCAWLQAAAESNPASATSRRGFTASQDSRRRPGFRSGGRSSPIVEPQAVMTAAHREHPVLSVVVPMYNEEGNVAPLVARIAAVMDNLDGRPAYEIVLVNDGSSDATARAIRAEMRVRAHLVLINLSRNFGHQLAATAGIELAAGDAVILMDGDLQDPPELIGAFVEKWRQGFDVVYAVRRTRKGENLFKVLTAGFFYRTIKRLTKVAIPVDTGDFRLMSRRVVEALRRSPERHRFLRGMVSWVGFNQVGVRYDRDERLSGTTKYPLPRMIRFAIDGITSFSDIPLRFASYFGFIVSALAFLYALVVIVAKLLRVNPPAYTPGWASTIVAVVFLGGVQLISLGILGEYLGRIYDEVKGRPLYLIDDVERS